MTEVKWIVSDDGRHEMRITGHANSGPVGQDLVCAAVSGITYCLAARMEMLYKQHKARGVVVEMGKGNARIGAAPGSQCGCAVREAYETTFAGLCLLQEKYPECIKCDYCEVKQQCML